MCSKEIGRMLMVSGYVLFMSGCTLIFGDDYEVRIEMNNDAYTLAGSTEMKMTIENRSDYDVYYLCGGEVFVDRFIDGELDASFGFPNCECLCPNPVEASQTEHRSYHVDEYLLEWIREVSDQTDATYRFRLLLYEDTGFEHELDLEDERSTAFRFVDPTGVSVRSSR